jgi:hypothetical protein
LVGQEAGWVTRWIGVHGDPNVDCAQLFGTLHCGLAGWRLVVRTFVVDGEPVVHMQLCGTGWVANEALGTGHAETPR